MRRPLIAAFTVVAMAALIAPVQATQARNLIDNVPVSTTHEYPTGEVWDIEPGPSGTVFVGGIDIGGIWQESTTGTVWDGPDLDATSILALDGDIVVAAGNNVIRYDYPSLTPVWSTDMGKKVTDVQSVQISAGERIIAGGDFANGLKLIVPDTGAISTYGFPTLTGQIDPPAKQRSPWGFTSEAVGKRASGPTGIAKIAVNSTGGRIVAIGEFTAVGGQARKQAFSMTLPAGSAMLNQWYIPALNTDCSTASPAFLRDVEFAPDNSYVMFAGKGGPNQSGIRLCDSAFKVSATPITSGTLTALRARTCADSLYSLAISPDGTDVAVGGHPKCMESTPGGPESENDPAGYPARYGLAMLATSNMTLRAYKSDKCRSEGARALTWTSAGLWVGYDCDFWGNSEGGNPDPTPQFNHERLAFLPAV